MNGRGLGHASTAYFFLAAVLLVWLLIDWPIYTGSVILDEYDPGPPAGMSAVVISDFSMIWRLVTLVALATAGVRTLSGKGRD